MNPKTIISLLAIAGALTWRAGAQTNDIRLDVLRTLDGEERPLASLRGSRVRAIAASFLCFDLGVDWRVGRDEWDRLLTEDEPALAAGNWQWIAGVGADLAAYPRIYNPRKQARRFDPSTAYVRRWLPELAGLPDAALFEPEAGYGEAQMELALFGPRSYPAPVVDHESVARAFLQRYGREVRSPA